VRPDLAFIGIRNVLHTLYDFRLRMRFLLQAIRHALGISARKVRPSPADPDWPPERAPALGLEHDRFYALALCPGLFLLESFSFLERPSGGTVFFARFFVRRFLAQAFLGLLCFFFLFLLVAMAGVYH
jgi:hypothetical protein